MTESNDGRTVNCVRSQCKVPFIDNKRVQEPMKGQGGLVSRSALAALVQEQPLFLPVPRNIMTATASRQKMPPEVVPKPGVQILIY